LLESAGIDDVVQFHAGVVSARHTACSTHKIACSVSTIRPCRWAASESADRYGVLGVGLEAGRISSVSAQGGDSCADNHLATRIEGPHRIRPRCGSPRTGRRARLAPRERACLPSKSHSFQPASHA
jgi:hypothetical protein